MFAAKNVLRAAKPAVPPTYDSVGAGAWALTAGNTSMTESHTVTGNCILMFVVAFTSGGSYTLSPKVGGSGGTAMTQIGSTLQVFVSGGTHVDLLIYQLLNSGLTGSQSMYLGSNITMNNTFNTLSYSGVNTIGSLVTNSGTTGTALSLTMSPGAGQIAVGGFTTHATASISGFSGGTERTNITNSPSSHLNFALSAGDNSTTGSGSFTATAGGSDKWGAVGVLLS